MCNVIGQLTQAVDLPALWKETYFSVHGRQQSFYITLKRLLVAHFWLEGKSWFLPGDGLLNPSFHSKSIWATLYSPSSSFLPWKSSCLYFYSYSAFFLLTSLTSTISFIPTTACWEARIWPPNVCSTWWPMLFPSPLLMSPRYGQVLQAGSQTLPCNSMGQIPSASLPTQTHSQGLDTKRKPVPSCEKSTRGNTYVWQYQKTSFLFWFRCSAEALWLRSYLKAEALYAPKYLFIFIF